MITKVQTIEELLKIVSESFLNKTDRVTKISDNSVLNGTFFSLAKLGQKALKEIALLETQILPESSTGEGLDTIAERLGIPKRYTNLRGTTYILFCGLEGTTYNKDLIVINSTSGISFNLKENITIGPSGYAYGVVESVELGTRANVPGLTINKIAPVPNGHRYLINEYAVTGGRDLESDNEFFKRIKNYPNLIAKKTLESFTQILLKENSNVLRVVYQGTNSTGKNVISVLSQNGTIFTEEELNSFELILSDYLSLSDLKTYEDKVIGVEVINAEYHPIDISFRCELENSYDPFVVRSEMQRQCTKILDLSEWDSLKKVEWEDFLIIVKNTRGVKVVPDQFFFPRVDITIPENKFPRIRGFRLLNLEGNIIADYSGNLSPIYFPTKADYNFQKSIENNI